uniref:LRAT domain-containing protein n=1 Tax=Anabas testudineus TaxID=64144 RepID=A0A3Q1JBQ2_ANATE
QRQLCLLLLFSCVTSLLGNSQGKTNLQLARSFEKKYQFGDIIAFPRKKICGCGPTLYSHYAIYVGNETIPGKEPGQDIFHRTQESLTSCKFGKLSEESKASNGQTHKENYLDDTERPFIKHNAILQRIKKMMKEKFCKLYSLFTNNCEHLATFVRYGKEISKQVCGR